MKNSRIRKIGFSTVLVLLLLLVLEALVSTFHFQRTANGNSALWEYSKSVIQVVLKRAQHLGIYEEHPLLGYQHRVNVKGDHFDWDYSVSYTIDEKRQRLIPKPAQSRGRIVFVGGSYTFGFGVEDDEPFPAILARDYWPEWRIENRAVSGYGTAHAYLTVLDELEGDDRPAAIIYPLLNGHIIRNYIRREWVHNLGVYGRQHPHFELINGNLVFEGLVGEEESLPGDERVAATERELTVRFVQEINRMCNEEGVAFFLVLLPGRQWVPSMVAGLYKVDPEPLDLSLFPLKAFVEDGHPNPEDHRGLAQAIADSFIGQWVTQAAATRPLHP